MREIGPSSSRKISSLAFRITGAWVIKRKPEALVSIFPISAGTCLRHTNLGGPGDSFCPLSLLRIPPQFLNSVSQLSSLPSEGISIHASCIPRRLEDSELWNFNVFPLKSGYCGRGQGQPSVLPSEGVREVCEIHHDFCSVKNGLAALTANHPESK